MAEDIPLHRFSLLADVSIPGIVLASHQCTAADLYKKGNKICSHKAFSASGLILRAPAASDGEGR